MTKLIVGLAGNPNVGKTTVFNQLTGMHQHVGNWPGKTVERAEGHFSHGNYDYDVVDLPGNYALSAHSMEEIVSRDFIVDDDSDVIINVVDAANLERNLYLTVQMMELGANLVLALNMNDFAKKKEHIIDIDLMSELLGFPVIEINAKNKDGFDELLTTVEKQSKNPIDTSEKLSYGNEIKGHLSTIQELIEKDKNLLDVPSVWTAVKLLEKDTIVIQKVQKSSYSSQIMVEVDKVAKHLYDVYKEGAEEVIANARYAFIDGLMAEAVKRPDVEIETTTDKIDKIVTNRWLALPIFAVVMFLVYFISVTTVGTWATDFMNGGVFGKGFKFFGIWVKGVPIFVGEWLDAIGCWAWLKSLIIDGIIAGVGAVLGFVPQIFVLFLILAFLEACGYMSRIAFVLDKLFRKFGLSGKSFIPMLIGTGCSVPGIMASRTIENDRDRKMTIMTTTFIPCGAKLPIIALIAGALFDGAWWVAPSAYFVGIAAVILSGIILKKTKMFAGDVAPFVMELPAYHMPTVGNVLRSMWERGWSFIKKAGTIILLSTIVLWFLMSYGWVDGTFTALEAEQLDSSILASIGGVVAPIFRPLGWGDWKSAVAAVTGLIAKENVVGTFGILYGFAEVAEDGTEIWGSLAASMTAVGAYSFLVFNLLCAPCFAAMGAIKREMNNAKWFWFSIGYQTILAYLVSLCVYQIGTLITTGTFGVGVVVAILVMIAFLYLLFRPYKQSKKLEAKAASIN